MKPASSIRQTTARATPDPILDKECKRIRAYMDNAVILDWSRRGAGGEPTTTAVERNYPEQILWCRHAGRGTTKKLAVCHGLRHKRELKKRLELQRRTEGYGPDAWEVDPTQLESRLAAQPRKVDCLVLAGLWQDWDRQDILKVFPETDVIKTAGFGQVWSLNS